ncbi:MAG: hypothetical protein HY331_12845, partial [Chloroflexi bacterium]|nr:hypothetical protein [Chloroflexota bacterium]
SNLTDVSFTLSFLTRHPSVAAVRYWISGTNPISGTWATDFRLTAFPPDPCSMCPGHTHWVRIGGAGTFDRLLPETTYQFAIFLDDGLEPVIPPGSLTTGPTLDVRQSDGAWGRVLDQDGYAVPGAIVYASLESLEVVISGTTSAHPHSTLLSAVTNDAGYWWIDLAGVRTLDLSAPFVYSTTDPVHLVARGGPNTIAFGDPSADPRNWPFNLTLREIVERRMALGIGWNAVGLPLEPTRPLSVSEVVRQVNDGGVTRLTSVFWYGETDGQWHGVSASGASLANPSDDFVLRPGRGYFFKMLQRFDWSLLGHELTETVPLRLLDGWNLVGVPRLTGLTAQDLSDAAGTISGTLTYNIREVDRWIYGGYEGHVSGYTFNDFPVVDTQGYFIRVNPGGAGILVPGDADYYRPLNGATTLSINVERLEAVVLQTDAVLPSRRRLEV